MPSVFRRLFLQLPENGLAVLENAKNIWYARIWESVIYDKGVRAGQTDTCRKAQQAEQKGKTKPQTTHSYRR